MRRVAVYCVVVHVCRANVRSGRESVGATRAPSLAFLLLTRVLLLPFVGGLRRLRCDEFEA